VGCGGDPYLKTPPKLSGRLVVYCTKWHEISSNFNLHPQVRSYSLENCASPLLKNPNRKWKKKKKKHDKNGANNSEKGDEIPELPWKQPHINNSHTGGWVI
jgi:hypothetical protein